MASMATSSSWCYTCNQSIQVLIRVQTQDSMLCPEIHSIPHLAQRIMPTARPWFILINPVVWASSSAFNRRVAFDGGSVDIRENLGRGFSCHRERVWGSRKFRSGKRGKSMRLGSMAWMQVG
ncbi:hypothetical protein ACFX14_000288 [Malus domestica]